MVEVDALMASSLCGYRDLLLTFQDTPIFHVTHHVDTRLPPPILSVQNQFSTGYFGELVNTIQDEAINTYVYFHSINTQKQSKEWLKLINRYCFHYAIRNTRDIDGSKPFLKGFSAAQVNANMMI